MARRQTEAGGRRLGRPAERQAVRIHQRVRRGLVVALAVLLAASAGVAAEDGAFPDIESCAVLAASRIPLGTTTAAELFVWNRSNEAIEYGIVPSELYLRYRDLRAPVPDSVPPDFKTLGSGELKFGGYTVPDDRVFRSDVTGEYEVPVELRLRRGDQLEVRTVVLTLTLANEPPPARYEVKPVVARDTKDHGRRIEAYQLDDTAWREACTLERQRIFQGATQDNFEDWLNREREYYDTACGHDGFGRSDDWAETGLTYDLETLLAGEYRIDLMAYRILYEVQYQARKKWGLSPYYAVKHAIWVFREEGEEAALKYLDGLGTAGWNCVDLAARDWTRSRIASWQGTGKPEGLVYSEELKRSNRLVFDKETGRLRLREQ